MSQTAQDNTVNTLEGEERGIPGVSARAGGDGNKAAGIMFIFICLIILGGIVYWKYMRGEKTVVEEKPKTAQVKQQDLPSKTFVLKPDPEPEPVKKSEPVAATESAPPVAPPRKGDAARAQAGGGLPTISKSGSKIALGGSTGGSLGSGSRSGGAPFQEENERRLAEAQSQYATANAREGEQKGAMGGMLEGTVTKSNAAMLLPDRNYLITKGTILQCALQTKIVTSVAGMTKCIMPTNVYSDNGKVLLLERGSEITGEFQAGMKQGMNRIFVLWTRIKTPSGIVVDLSSPGTGQLGEAGVDGYIDNHFWKRFGGAIMLSLIDDLGNALAKESGDSTINLGSTSDSANDMAAEALRATINIPPTLYKNQGEAVGIYLARDLDFRSVYDLSPER